MRSKYSSRPVRTIVGVVTAAVVIAIGAGFALRHDGAGADDRSPASTPRASPTSTHRSIPGLLPEASFADYAPAGEKVTYDDGTTAVLDDGRLVVTYGGDRREAVLADVSGGPTLSRSQLQLGQAGAGYVVRQGSDDLSVLTVYVPTTDGGLVAASVEGGVPIGTGRDQDGRAYTSWTTEDGAQLFTRVQNRHATAPAYRVYRWEVTGPGEGGGEADDTTPALVPTSIGEVCMDTEVHPTEAWRC